MQSFHLESLRIYLTAILLDKEVTNPFEIFVLVEEPNTLLSRMAVRIYFCRVYRQSQIHKAIVSFAIKTLSVTLQHLLQLAALDIPVVDKQHEVKFLESTFGGDALHTELSFIIELKELQVIARKEVLDDVNFGFVG